MDITYTLSRDLRELHSDNDCAYPRFRRLQCLFVDTRRTAKCSTIGCSYLANSNLREGNRVIATNAFDNTKCCTHCSIQPSDSEGCAFRITHSKNCMHDIYPYESALANSMVLSETWRKKKVDPHVPWQNGLR